ncbi:MAG: hypothetical protein CMJ32_10985 [Phycisphaerae bacterium]|nr:hypothetical protein [Phycisphaerae bacterium]
MTQGNRMDDRNADKVVVIGPERWLEHARRFSDFTHLQESVFATAMADRTRSELEHVVIERSGMMRAAAIVRIHHVPIGRDIAYINGGPLMLLKEAGSSPPVEDILAALRSEYQVRRGCLLYIQPTITSFMEIDDLQGQILAGGFEPDASRRRYRTILIRTDASIEVMRQSLHGKWRNSLKKAESSGLEIEDDDSPEMLARVDPLFSDLVQQKSFKTLMPSGTFTSLQWSDGRSPVLRAAVASLEGTDVACLLYGMHGLGAIYLVGASGADGRRINASYLLQWHVIRRCHDAGVRWYDLGGIDTDDNPDVYRFKDRMGGKKVELPGQWRAMGGGVRGLLTRSLVRLHLRRNARITGRSIR